MSEELKPFTEWFDREVETGVRYSDNVTASLGPWSERREKFIRTIMQGAFFAAWNQRAKPVVKALEWQMRDSWYAEFPQLMAAYTIFFEQGKWWIAEIADAPPFDTDAAAKEYAQGHVNNRVHKCLEGYDD